jgi:hypothetical protein
MGIDGGRWLAAHSAVVAAGLVLVVVGSSLVLALTTAWSVGNTGEFGAIIGFLVQDSSRVQVPMR